MSLLSDLGGGHKIIEKLINEFKRLEAQWFVIVEADQARPDRREALGLRHWHFQRSRLGAQFDNSF
jgi:hypothetical protein